MPLPILAAATDEGRRRVSRTDGELVTEAFEYDGGRQVTVYVKLHGGLDNIYCQDVSWSPWTMSSAR